ncbi:unnamed protein product, partial [Schistosoma turkestanicum]
ALLLRRKLEKSQELNELNNNNNNNDNETYSLSDHNFQTKFTNSNQPIKLKHSSLYNNTSYVQKSATSPLSSSHPSSHYYQPRPNHRQHHEHQPHQYQKNQSPRHFKHSKYKWRQTRSISDDYELQLRDDLVKDLYHSDEASLNNNHNNNDSSLSSESSKLPTNHHHNQWFRTSSSYNLTADYPNRQWKPRGTIRTNMHKDYPHEYHESPTIMERLFNTRHEGGGIRRKPLHYLHANKILYPLRYYPQSFKSYTYSGRISPEKFKYGAKRLANQYPMNRYYYYYSKHEPHPMSSSSNEDRYPDNSSTLTNRNYPNQTTIDHCNKNSFLNVLNNEQCLIASTRSRSTSPKRIHNKFIGSSCYDHHPHPHSSRRSTEIDYNSLNVPIHRTTRHHHRPLQPPPTSLGMEYRRWPIRER